jgi:N-methylhydantoinase A/oxoprolinase/acetone carboxylase beta subunit
VQIGVDIGGTFTDIAAVTQVLALAGARPSDIERFIHGTTIATNAILEQKGAVTAVLTTEGFEDVLELGRMKRSRMYDLAMDPEVPTFLAPRRRRLGIRERLDARGRILTPAGSVDRWGSVSRARPSRRHHYSAPAALRLGLVSSRGGCAPAASASSACDRGGHSP